MHGEIKNGRNTSNFQIFKVVEFHRLAKKDHVRLNLLKDTLMKPFVDFRNKQQKCIK